MRGSTLDLKKFSEAELIELNRRIVDRLKYLSHSRSLEEMARFRVGDSVAFEPESGRRVVGTVVRLNSKTVTVATTEGAQWRVAPALLSRIVDAGAAGTVVSLREHASRLG